MRPIALVFAVTALAAAVVVGGCATEAKDEPIIRPALVERAQPADFAVAESYAGDVRARFESRLGFRVAGKLENRRVDVGSRVRAGDVIAELDPGDFALAVQSAEAAVASAEADASLARAELARHRELLDRRYISQALYDARATAAEAADARLRQAQSQLAQARNQAGYAVLVADADGVITAISAEAGQVVAAGAPVATLAHGGDVEVLIAVPESRVATFKPGMAVAVDVWAKDNARFPGRVREIAPEADPRTRTFDVRVTLDDAAAVQLGMTARVHVAGTDAPASMLLPLSALHRSGDSPAVWVVDPASGRVRMSAVEVLAYREEGVVLRTGIDASTWVVVAGVHKLVDGQTVRPIGRDNRPLDLGPAVDGSAG